VRAKEVRKPKVEKYRREASIRHDMQASDSGGGGSRGEGLPLSLSLSEKGRDLCLARARRE